MKNFLIIYPHWPPSNLAGVHRPRLIANFIEEFGWHPIVLTVDSKYYEEPLDPDMIKTVRPGVEVVYTRAWRVPKPRIFGDIGIRGFKFLYRKALELIANRDIKFVWIPVPSFYTSLLGRLLYEKTGVPYGIDYIDPWVRDISGRRNLRSVLSNWLAGVLEPYALRKAALVTGVAEKYFLPALERTFGKRPWPATLAFPYGFDPRDHQLQPSGQDLPWQDCDCKPLVYAGAFLPNSEYFYEVLFEALAEVKFQLSGFKLFFVGFGNYSVKQMARSAGIGEFVVEINRRYPYLQVLKILEQAYGVMVIGSTEQHYTASKIFQALLSGRPVFAVFHHLSSTVRVLEEAGAADFLVRYYPEQSREELKAEIVRKFSAFLSGGASSWSPDLQALDRYSARENARLLAEKFDKLKV